MLEEYWIEKNKTQKIKISLNEFKENKFLDLRIFYYNDDEEIYKPTKKGISISIDKIDDLIDKIEKLKKEIS